MGGADTTSQTSSQQTTQLPPWINTAAQQNYAQAQNIAAQPLQQYQGQLVAGVSPQMQQSWNTAAQGANAGADQYNAAQAGYLGVLGQQPQNVTAGQLSNTNLSPYMNPYTQSVINSTLPIMQQQLGQAQIGNQSQAAGAGAYGGSRQAIQQGVTQAQGAQNMAQMAAQLNQANYGQAQGAAQSDIATNLQAQLANQQAQQNQGALNLQAAGGLGVLGQQAQLSQARNFTEQMTAGTAEQAQQQNEINANLAQYQQALQYPYQQLGVLQSALGMTPYGQSQTGQATQTTQQSMNPAQIALGGLTSLGNLFGSGGMFGSSGAFAGLLGGSDRRLKTDITKVGVHPAGIPLYAYRYKGDPKSYPKAIGPMAEDVAKIAPHAVAKIPGSGGKMAVHPAFTGGTAAAFAPRAPAVATGAGPNLAAIMNPGGPQPRMSIPRAPFVPGALSAPGPAAGGIGALGGSMRPPQAPRIRRMRQPIAGALVG
jgi:hypothetical protein